METNKFSQFGKYSVMVLLPIMVFFIIMMFVSGFDDTAGIIFFGFMIVTFLICLLMFYKITIYVDNTSVSFKLGIGLISKKFLLSDIEICKAVKNPALYGLGIHYTPDGWLYNVSGRDAIELTFKNNISKILIGTDKPEEVSRLINQLLNKNDNFQSVQGNNQNIRTSAAIFWVILIVAVLFPIVLIIYGSSDTKVKLSDYEIIISGMYGLNIKYNNIIQTDTIRSLPRISIRTNGYAAGKTLKGNFKLKDQSKVKLFITKGIPPYIRIKTSDAVIYLNFINHDSTVQTYNKLISHIN
jgi:hypothetical protein